MSITSATFKVQSIIQKLIPPPYHIDQNRRLILINPLYFQTRYKNFRMLHYFLVLFWHFPLAFARLAYLFLNWNTYTVFEMEQAVFYVIFVCVILIYIPAEHLQCTQYFHIIYLTNETISIVPAKFTPTNTIVDFKLPIFDKSCLNEICIYSFSICFASVVPACFAAPFALSYLPLQLVLGNSYLVKLCEAVLFLFGASFGVFTFLSVNLLAFMFLDNIMCYTKSFFPEKDFGPRFSKYSNRFRKCQVLLKLGALIYTHFLTSLIFVGILLASSCACIAIKMYGEINILIYLLFPSLTMICVVNAVALTYLGSIPYRHSENFKSFWAKLLTRKEDKRLLRACKPIGFELGPYGLCTTALGLRICDDMIHNTVTILLLGFL